MDGETLEIRLKIAGKTYTMQIPPEKEEAYRLAERVINRHVAEYEKARLDGYGPIDYLAIVALQLAVSNIRMTQSRQVGDSDLQRIAELSDALKEHLNR